MGNIPTFFNSNGKIVLTRNAGMQNFVTGKNKLAHERGNAEREAKSEEHGNAGRKGSTGIRAHPC